MVMKTRAQTTIRMPVMTQAAMRSPLLLTAVARAKVAVTKAVLGKTKDHQVIWKGIVCSGRTYFHREPTEARKNQTQRPQSQRPAIMESSSRIATVCPEACKLSGIIIWACWPRETVTVSIFEIGKYATHFRGEESRT